MNDADHPWLRPLWRRVAVVAFAAGWSLFEFYNGAPFWGVLAGAMAAYGAWQYLIAWKPSGPGGEGKEP